MTQKTLLIIAYSLLALLLFLLVLELKRRYEWPTGSLLIATLLCLLPRRIVDYYWRDFMQGNHYLDKQKYSRSIAHNQKFLVQLKRKPWIKHLIWIAPSFWTISTYAMTLNNLGLALLNHEDCEQAQEAFLKALEYDPQYALPHYNLAAIAVTQLNFESAIEHLKLSKRLGFSHKACNELLSECKTLSAQKMLCDYFENTA
jgi:tetratricopeptide (TPR) repeat protein